VNANRGLAGAEERVRDRLRTLCPQFTPDGPAWHTETSLLVPGRADQTRVLAKHPVDPRPFWQARARHEITVYAAIAAAGPPPVPLPRITGADHGLPVIMITLLPGSPLASDRFPASPLSPSRLDQLLDAAQALNDWSHPALGIIPPDTDYPAQFQALPADLFNPGEPATLAGQAGRLACRLGTRLEHGDPHPGNALAFPGSPLALIDLESLAPRLPGYDLAVLWTVTGPGQQLRNQITSRIGPSPHERAAFWLNAVLVTSREVLSHRRSAPTAAHRDRLARLHHDLKHARAQITGRYAAA
jgi:Phosphotransferase enzyme family